MADVEAYLQGIRRTSPLYTHEYTNKLWVEDPAPAIENIKGYLASDYDFPPSIERWWTITMPPCKELRRSRARHRHARTTLLEAECA
jgi:hypothetical protein